jgi:hypothetical protein
MLVPTKVVFSTKAPCQQGIGAVWLSACFHVESIHRN